VDTGSRQHLFFIETACPPSLHALRRYSALVREPAVDGVFMKGR
jgi:hypothetical protein